MLSVSLASVLCKVRGLILEGAELAGLAELESDLKKYGSLLWDFFAILHLLEVVLVQLTSVDYKIILSLKQEISKPPKELQLFFSGSDSTSANPANSGPL